MNREEFFNAIRDDFFEERTFDFELFKETIKAVAPVFGELEVEIKDGDVGNKTLTFIDRDEAQFIVAPEGTDTSDVNTDMSTVVLTMHLNKYNVVTAVEHNFGLFTRANKNSVLFYAGLIGKKMEVSE